ncbi:MAG: hypothetical protein B6241_08095 [Spirochaetaceae bacterium 4572_59]|nr:MAG: hypothetical protein B6241_08095 [Spirochaetaceae bacterium 4572_59]
MSQKQQYTEFWKLLSLTEDYLKFGKKTGEYIPPVFSDSPAAVVNPGSSSPVPRNHRVKQNTEHPLVPLNTESACEHCSIAKMGKTPVPAIGTESPRLLVLCGPPSVDAEQSHVPLAAEEMDSFLKWISAIDLDLEKDVLLMNFPRCRPPGNRPPFQDEMKRCATIVQELLERVKPVLILTLGPIPSAFFTGNPGMKVSAIRENVAHWNGVPVCVSYSPDQVLSYDELKRPVWEDLKRVRDLINGA